MSKEMKQVIARAVKHDLSQKKRDRYTVSELIQTSKISRSTLYYHFDSGLTGAFLFTFHYEVIEPISRLGLIWPNALLFILHYFMNHQFFVLNLYHLCEGGQYLNFFRTKLYQTLLQNYLQHSRATLRPHDQQALQILCSALVTELQCWAREDFGEHADQIAARLYWQGSGLSETFSTANFAQNDDFASGLIAERPV